MKKMYINYFVLVLIVGCAAPDFYSVEDVEKERLKMEKGKNQSADKEHLHLLNQMIGQNK